MSLRFTIAVLLLPFAAFAQKPVDAKDPALAQFGIDEKSAPDRRGWRQ